MNETFINRTSDLLIAFLTPGVWVVSRPGDYTRFYEPHEVEHVTCESSPERPAPDGTLPGIASTSRESPAPADD